MIKSKRLKQRNFRRPIMETFRDSEAAKRGFGRDENGGMTIIALFVFILMLTMGGISVDLMRHEVERARLQATLDSAVLAAANLAQPQHPKAVVEDYFAKAGLSHALNSIEASDYETKINSKSITASADITVNTYLMKLMGVPTLNVAAGSAAEEAIGNIEVSLVLDISGSMRFNDRIGALRPAAREFVTTLLTGEAANTTSINVVPYAGQTNPGPLMFSMMDGVRYGTTGDDLFATTASTESTVFYFDRNTDDSHPYDYAVMIDDYPSGAVAHIDKDDLDTYLYFAAAYIRREVSNLNNSDVLVGLSSNFGGGNTDVVTPSGSTTSIAPLTTSGAVDDTLDFDDFHPEVIPQLSSCIEVDSTDFDQSGLPNAGDYAQTGHFMYWPVDWDEMDWGWCPEDDMAIVYAQNDEAALHTYIDNMRLHDGTGTHYAIKYGLALLDPSSRDEFQALQAAGLVPSAFADRPHEWSNNEVQKFIVLMTDGKITDQYRPTDPLDPIHETVELKNQGLSDQFKLTTRSDNVDRFYSICNDAKANGVAVYTIAFETNATGQEEMRNCATSGSHYFEASRQEISDVFATIASQITQLRLTQ